MIKACTASILIFFCFEKAIGQQLFIDAKDSQMQFHTKAAEGRKKKPHGILTKEHPAMQEVIATKEKHARHLMQEYPEVFSTGVGLDTDGSPILHISIDKKSPRAEMILQTLLKRFKDVRAIISLGERPRPFGCSLLGVSGGQAFGFTANYTWDPTEFDDPCCGGGTLGSLVWISGDQYILSNYHVLELEGTKIYKNADLPPHDLYPVVQRISEENDPIVSPGPLDSALNLVLDTPCLLHNENIVGFLRKRNALPDNNVDCAIAIARPGVWPTDGAIREIGVISAETTDAFLGQLVQKTGRTTGHTTGEVVQVDYSTSIPYSTYCDDDEADPPVVAFEKDFSGQILIGPEGFAGPGDSGSLIVELERTPPFTHVRAVGLLFAGSTSFTVANPIDEVLSFLGASMVGSEPV